ncbi:MAG: S24 family peptidase [Paludibacteraceae bacterium]|nr:S24 family peptidase [Paludibacteraceae bacterium]
MQTTVKERLIQYLKYKRISQRQFQVEIGLSSSYVTNISRSIQPDKIDRISNRFTDLNTGWLLTGDGEMLKNNIEIVVNSIKGVPYFNVDFICGFDIVENNQSSIPDGYINFPQYDKADYWVNATGNSMEPLISHGDIIAIKKVEEWDSHLLYGEVYAIVTDGYRTIKKVRKSAKGEEWLRIIPVNVSEYDEQDIPKSIVINMFQVLGTVKKIF